MDKIMFFCSELTKSRAKERVRETDGSSADNHYVMNGTGAGSWRWYARCIEWIYRSRQLKKVAFSIRWHHHSFFACTVPGVPNATNRNRRRRYCARVPYRVGSMHDGNFFLLFCSPVYANIIKYAICVVYGFGRRSVMLNAHLTSTVDTEHCCQCARARPSAYSRSGGKWTKFHYRSICFRHQRHQSSHSARCSCRVALLFMCSNLNAWCDSSVKFYPSALHSVNYTQTLQWWVVEKGLRKHSTQQPACLPL